MTRAWRAFLLLRVSRSYIRIFGQNWPENGLKRDVTCVPLPEGHGTHLHMCLLGFLHFKAQNPPVFPTFGLKTPLSGVKTLFFIYKWDSKNNPLSPRSVLLGTGVAVVPFTTLTAGVGGCPRVLKNSVWIDKRVMGHLITTFSPSLTGKC